MCARTETEHKNTISTLHDVSIYRRKRLQSLAQ